MRRRGLTRWLPSSGGREERARTSADGKDAIDEKGTLKFPLAPGAKCYMPHETGVLRVRLLLYLGMAGITALKAVLEWKTGAGGRGRNRPPGCGTMSRAVGLERTVSGTEGFG